ncbi:MAG: hypothetical protein CMN87_18220 [Stappia sp.]|uniref:phage capsid protein n=1 Tax=Stappia sp. TaxID=1870903 RepID=UPI000C358F3D|nr:phage capsid protein [Stappia sp.]MAA97409.1 hypothetical protein [Stappia sp.]MBM21942.1 hypothetical protein [Stappia sp.]|tara:strand:+ start:3074 stop:4024 length:951 start_codon:yes stop_codon:yes gene_type:complete
MTTQAPNWYREKIRDMVRARYQSRGGYLDGTMVQGDGGAGEVKFPVVGRVEAYELGGSIQKITNTNPSLNMIKVSMRDFEASAWMRVQDARRQGPNEQAAVGRMMSAAIRRKRDNLKLEALNIFVNGVSTLDDDPKECLKLGDGSARIDIVNAMDAIDHVSGAGNDDDDNGIFWAIPHAWMSQLEMYEEIKNADYAGPTDLPFAKSSKVKARTVRGCHILALPNEHFTVGTGAFGTGSNGRAFDDTGYIDTFLWVKDAVGAETEWNKENMSLTSHADYEGTPMLGKVGLSGASIGILPEGVVRLRYKAINSATRPA